MNNALARFSGKALKLAVAAAALAAASAVQAVSIVKISSGPQDGNHDLDRLIEPSCCGFVDYGLHDHGYVADYVPDPSRGYVVFKFDAPVFVRGMTMVQHQNGLTLLEHLAGRNLDSLVSEGTSWGNRGDVTGSSIFEEFERDQFAFSGTETGRFHKFIIRKTSFSEGYASYRWYLDFEAAPPVPEPATSAMFVAGMLAVLGLVRRQRTVTSPGDLRRHQLVR